MITSQHVNCDARLVAFLHSRGGLGAWRIVEADQAPEHKVTLNRSTINLVSLFQLDVIRLGSQSKDAKTHAGESLHVLKNLLLKLLSDRNSVV